MKKLLFAILLFSTMCYAENSKNTETIDNPTSIVSNYNNPYKYVGEIKYYIVINTLFETLKDSQKDFYGRFSLSLYTKDNRYFLGKEMTNKYKIPLIFNYQLSIVNFMCIFAPEK